MSKKIVMSVLFINLLMSSILIFYIFFQPEKDEIERQLPSYTLISYETLDDYLLSSGDSSTHYLFFCSPSNPDCIYVQDTIIKPLEVKQGSSLFSRIDYVDVTSLEESLDTNKIAAEWGISSYPALISVTIEDGEFVINNSIQYAPDNPFNELELKRWLSENNIWSGLFEETEKEIEIPR